MSKRKSALLLAAAFHFATPALAQTAAPVALPDADPAIWVVKDPDTTIYLFGTFHALDGKSDWFNEEVKNAFDKSNEVVLEIPPVEDKAALQPLIMKYAADTSGKALSDKLSRAAKDKYLKQLAGIGIPATAFDNFKPFLPALTIIMANAAKLGFTGEQGAEAVLTKAARDGKKPISGLETFDYQMSLFAGMSDADQVKMLEETLDEVEKLGPLFAEMNKHWTAGDSEGMAKLMNEMEAQSPAMYKTLLTDRNVNWAGWIAKRLEKAGTVFVGVGAGHLGGKDSVQTVLASRGIKSERVAAETTAK
jgi:uncharacterized protein YbaP (TraB family)